MTAISKKPFPNTAVPWFNAQGQQALGNYFLNLDQLISALLIGNLGAVLIQAANDAAAAKAGVAIGQLYRNGNAVQVRLQ